MSAIATWSRTLLMTFAKKMRVEFVYVIALFPADVALPGVGVAVAALVQEVEGGVGKGDGAEGADQRGGVEEAAHGLGVGGGDHAAFRW